MLVSRFFTEPVNYKDAAGEWQKIDNDLERVDRGYANKANRYRLELPEDLSRPVRVSEGGAWVEYRLVGAAAAGAVKNNEASYRGALPGVDVAYSADGDSVKESLALTGPESQSTFRFELKLSPGLTPVKRSDGAIHILDASGTLQFSFAPPLMYDSSNKRSGFSRKVSIDLARADDGHTLTVRPDGSWLGDKDRQWPVVIDPTITFAGAERDCYIVGATPELGDCGSPHLLVGNTITTRSRALLKFNLGSTIPREAVVRLAKFGLYSDTGGPAPTDVHGLTRAWPSPTWRRYDSVNSWTTAGGDFEPDAAAHNPRAGGTGWSHWFPTGLVQRWTSGETPNHGFLVKGGSHVTEIAFRSSDFGSPATNPFLEVRWEPRTGEQSFHTFENKRLTDRSSLGVNVANGNLLVRNSDLRIRGTGLDLDLHRSYNSLSTGTGSVGRGWTIGPGEDLRIYDEEDGSVTFHGPSGYIVPFLRKADGSFESPPGLRATLKRPTDSTYELTYHENGEKLSFASSGRQSWGRLTSHADRYGNKLSFGAPSGDVSWITDTRQRGIRVIRNASGHTEKVDVADRVMQYEYDSRDRLVTYTDAASKRTTYGYDAADRLVSITTPAGRVTRSATTAKRALRRSSRQPTQLTRADRRRPSATRRAPRAQRVRRRRSSRTPRRRAQTAIR